MPEVEPVLNPYAPTVLTDGEMVLSDRPSDDYQPSTLKRTAVRWLIVCGISAVPSFFFGLIATSGQFVGMLAGILIFVVGYTLLDYRTANRPFRRNRMIRRTLKITYGTRIAISILFPVGGYLDMVCGVVTLTVMQETTGAGFQAMGSSNGPSGFFITVTTTVLQGLVLNVVLAVYAALLLGLQGIYRVFTR